MSLLLPVGLATAVLAARDTELDARIAALRLPLVLDEEGREISGPGAEFLLAEGSKSSFFLVGEMHGNRETPRLTEALLMGLRPHGYGVLAVMATALAAIILVAVRWLEGHFKTKDDEHPSDAT